MKDSDDVIRELNARAVAGAKQFRSLLKTYIYTHFAVYIPGRKRYTFSLSFFLSRSLRQPGNFKVACAFRCKPSLFFFFYLFCAYVYKYIDVYVYSKNAIDLRWAFLSAHTLEKRATGYSNVHHQETSGRGPRFFVYSSSSSDLLALWRDLDRIFSSPLPPSLPASHHIHLSMYSRRYVYAFILYFCNTRSPWGIIT